MVHEYGSEAAADAYLVELAKQDAANPAKKLFGGDKPPRAFLVHEYDSEAAADAYLVELAKLDGLNSQGKSEASTRGKAASSVPNTPVLLQKTSKNDWGPKALRKLWNQSKEPGATHKKLAEEYCVSRQLIGRLLKKAEGEFGVRKAQIYDSIHGWKARK